MRPKRCGNAIINRVVGAISNRVGMAISNRGWHPLRGGVKKGHLGVGLCLADDEVADEVAGVVGGNHAALFGTEAGATCHFACHNGFVFFCPLKRMAVCRFAVDEPIGSWFCKVVATLASIHIDQRGSHYKVGFEVGLFAPRVFHNEPQASYLGSRKHFDGEGKELLSIFGSL